MDLSLVSLAAALCVLLLAAARRYRATAAPAREQAKAIALEPERSPKPAAKAPESRLALTLTGKTGQPTKVTPNEPFDVRTAWFEGQMVVMVKGLPMRAAFEPLFAGKQRIFEVQLQGKFPRGPPPGEVFIGARLVEDDALGTPVKMVLGFLSRTLAVAVLRFLRAFVPALHFSFGSDAESAHISAPLFAPAKARAWTVRRTPAGEAPPPLGAALEKNSEKTKTVVVDGDSTYTIAYYTPNLDLPHWSLVNLPGLSGRNVDLRYFWRDHAFAIEVYALKRGATTHGEAQKDHIAELVVSPDASRAAAAAPVSVAAPASRLPVEAPKKPRASVRAYRRFEVAVSRWAKAVGRLSRGRTALSRSLRAGFARRKAARR